MTTPNIYIGQMKDTIKNFAKKMQTYKEQREDNAKRYSPQFADQENEKIIEKEKEAYKAAKQSIEKTFLTTRKYLAIASFPHVEELSADRLFFENDSVDFTREEILAYLDRYETNYTMKRVIKNWIDKHDPATSPNVGGVYSGIVVVMPLDVLLVYQKFGSSALSMIDKVYESGVVQEYELEAFADARFAHDLFDIIGSGTNLVDYGSRRVPEIVLHAFDNIVLENVYSEPVQFSDYEKIHKA